MMKWSWVVFWLLMGAFLVIDSVFLIPAARELLMGITFLIVTGAVFLALGVALILLTVKEKVAGALKKFLILTGASVVGIPVSVVLHNAIYGLFIAWFGANFWDRVGLGDEPFFFFMAIVVCPLAFLVGAIGTIVLVLRGRRLAGKSVSG
ncbi:MAG: hypothetical protein JSW30_01745 [Dehalococcoidia bacterium]|nr:MAG: hypothetical protein JSW30_01745 [Dehalococcoidia bacterium]